MKIAHQTWLEYVQKLDEINSHAADLMRDWVEKHGLDDRDALIRYAYALATKYGEAAGALACEMYDMTAVAAGKVLPSAEIATTATGEEVGKAINGSLKHSMFETPSVIYRLVKQVAADTTLKNARRDGAEFAWIPHGDTCPFCIMLASNGWQRKSAKDHAEHIHQNCDCQYAVRFSSRDGVAGYDPDKYLEMYSDADGGNYQEKLNSMRRKNYKANRDEILEQQRAAYEMRKEYGEE